MVLPLFSIDLHYSELALVILKLCLKVRRHVSWISCSWSLHLKFATISAIYCITWTVYELGNVFDFIFLDLLEITCIGLQPIKKSKPSVNFCPDQKTILSITAGFCPCNQMLWLWNTIFFKKISFPLQNNLIQLTVTWFQSWHCGSTCNLCPSSIDLECLIETQP